jgi:hypothetical protein
MGKVHFEDQRKNDITLNFLDASVTFTFDRTKPIFLHLLKTWQDRYP